jgi:hypothetical protein
MARAGCPILGSTFPKNAIFFVHYFFAHYFLSDPYKSPVRKQDRTKNWLTEKWLIYCARKQASLILGDDQMTVCQLLAIGRMSTID